MIEIKNLSFGYRSKKLLYKNFNLKLETGSIYGLLGKNGAGKSTQRDYGEASPCKSNLLKLKTP